MLDSRPSQHTEQYALSTSGNVCKWATTERKRGEIDLTSCNAAFAYAISANQSFRGHNLCWGNNNPKWLDPRELDATELEHALVSHITAVMQGVRRDAGGASPLAWDVVNEAVNDTHFFKPNTWFPALANYVDVAFRAARRADPTPKLFYNDFAVAGLSAKSNTMYAMVKSMVERGVPIDGVGLQAHLHLDGLTVEDEAIEELKLEFAPSLDELSKNIARYGALGLEVRAHYPQ